MSSGRFESAFYETNGGAIMRCRVQPETLSATIGGQANATAAGPATAPGSARSGGGNRQFGVKMRAVTVRWTTAPAGYDVRTLARIPILQKDTWDALNGGEAVAYNGGTGTVVGVLPEYRK